MAQAEAEAIKLRYCPACKFDLPTSLFYGKEGTCGGLSSMCRLCAQAYSRRYRSTHKTQPVLTRPHEQGLYKQIGSVRLADDLAETRIAEFLAETHSREYLLALCYALSIVEEPLPK